MALINLLVGLTLCGTALSCSFPPSMWCSSRDIARECQVELHCEKNVWTTYTDAPKVGVSLYFESLCPGCRGFIHGQLYPTWKSVGNIMDLNLYPYGNAHESQEGGKWKFQCQHGPEECYGNLIETCAIGILKNISVYFPFIHCIEGAQQTPRQSAPVCAKQMSIDYSKIMTCVNGPMGNKLEHEMAVKTGSLNPPHKYVPWVTLNGVHTEQIQKEAMMNLLQLVCDTYKGTKPPACKQTLTFQCLRD